MYYNVHVLVISMYASMKCLKISKGKSKKDSRYNGQKDKRINNDLQNITQKTEDACLLNMYDTIIYIFSTCMNDISVLSTIQINYKLECTCTV
jgi:hypothetical protein